MRRIVLPVIATCLALAASGGTIQQQVSPLGSGVIQYAFQLVGFNLTQGEALDFQFDPSVYASLSGASTPSGFFAIPLQPNNPPGTSGDLIVEEQSTGPVSGSAGPFTVNATLTTSGQPGVVAYNLYSVDNTGTFGSVIQSGVTSLEANGLATPEPGSFALAGLSLVVAGILRKRVIGR